MDGFIKRGFRAVGHWLRTAAFYLYRNEWVMYVNRDSTSAEEREYL